MNGCAKYMYMFSNWDSICNNNNVCNVLHLSYKIDTTSNSKEFNFSKCYIYCMMNDFSNNVLSSTDM